jgi:hypothetical protein
MHDRMDAWLPVTFHLRMLACIMHVQGGCMYTGTAVDTLELSGGSYLTNNRATAGAGACVRAGLHAWVGSIW